MKTKLEVVYNAPYHSEFNPIGNVFLLFGNKLNRNETTNIYNIAKITEDFILKNHETKLKNIFDNSVDMIDSYIKDNTKLILYHCINQIVKLCLYSQKTIAIGLIRLFKMSICTKYLIKNIIIKILYINTLIHVK